MLALAAVGALAIVLFGSLTLYLNYIFIEKERSATFTYVQAVEEKPIEPPESQHKKNLSGGSASSASAITPNVIVSTSSDSSLSISPMEIDMGEGLGAALTDGLGFSFGLAGDGFGEGFGSGSGRGNGSGNEGGKRAGYNDDIQVILALDASGSMDQLFTAVANSLEKVLTTLSSARLNGKKTKVNVGIVVYGQGHSNGAPFKLSGFTTKLAQLRNKVKETACDGYNEECGSAILFAVNKFPWNMRDRDDMLKVIFVCGNEPFDQGPVDFRNAITQAQAKNIIINTVHCGPEDEQWKEAAELGQGVGLSFEMTENEESAKPDVEGIRSTLQALNELPLLPIGAPAVQQELLSRHKPAPNPPKGEKQLNNWLGRNRPHVITGYNWDAVEICRRTGSARFELTTIGGRGNLPLSLRGQTDEEALQHIRELASRREQLLQRYKEVSGGSDFASQILETLREQALQKGINIEL